MDDRLARLESKVEELSRFVDHLSQQLTALENRPVLIDRQPAAAAAVRGGDVATAPESIVAPAAAAIPISMAARVLPLIGRTLVVFGGAYLLRALTESGVVAPQTGITIGLVYALAWNVMTDRAARRGDRLGAMFHAVPATLIAFPLVWEATARFAFLSPPASAAAVAVVTGAGLAVAWRQRLQVVAWLTTLAALISTLLLIGATGTVVPYTIFLIVLGIATLWFGYVLDWLFLRWPVALVADVTVLALTLRAVHPMRLDAPGPVLAVQLILLAAYLGSVAARTLFRGRDVIPFEVFQTLAAVGVGFGGAVSVERAVGSGATALGWASVAFAAALYAVAFAFVEGRQGRRKNFFFYSSLALLFTLVGGPLVLDGPSLGLAWAAFGVLAAWLGARSARATLSLHGAIYALAATLACGLLVSAGYALTASAASPWPTVDAPCLVVLAAVVVCSLLPVSTGEEPWGRYARVPRLAVVAMVAWTVGGVAIALLTPMLAGQPGAADPGRVAAIRMGVLVAGALVLAWTGRYERFLEGGWLVYPVLLAGGVKLLVEDFPHSRAAMLFVTLALYGFALIAAPRITRGRQEAVRRSYQAPGAPGL